MTFVLDPRLEGDTIAVASLTLCELLIMNDARYPWAILVPRLHFARELHDLNQSQQACVWADVLAVSEALAALDGVEKVNVGALGNIVAQLHIHVIARHSADPAWPGPVWGHSPRVPYGAGEVDDLMHYLRAIRP